MTRSERRHRARRRLPTRHSSTHTTASWLPSLLSTPAWRRCARARARPIAPLASRVARARRNFVVVRRRRPARSLGSDRPRASVALAGARAIARASRRRADALPRRSLLPILIQSAFKGSNAGLKSSARAPVARVATVVRANGTDYGLGVEMKTTAQKSIAKGGRAPVPLELEKASQGSRPSSRLPAVARRIAAARVAPDRPILGRDRSHRSQYDRVGVVNADP